MSQCLQQQDFCGYFKENMDGLGLDVSQSLFATQVKAIETITIMLAAIKAVGAKATIGELTGATIGLEKLAVIGALSASYYVGAAVGSLAVATGRHLACGTSIADALAVAGRSGINASWIYPHLSRHPEILSSRYGGRSTYRSRAMA
jgi:hypothetical protein